MQELRDLIQDPNCIGVWFGFPCGTFSSARRNDGGPPPLRGITSEDIWGLPHLTGRERDRVRSANKLLLRMREQMRVCEKHNVPFYLENPQRSKLWCHPLITKWVRHKRVRKVEFNYCQFGTTWKNQHQVYALAVQMYGDRARQEICLLSHRQPA